MSQNNSVFKQIEQLAENIVLVEQSDLQALAGLHSMFSEIAESLDKLGRDDVKALALTAASKIEAVILDDDPEPSKTLDELTEVVSGMQQAVRDELPLDKVTLPASYRNDESSDAKTGKTESSADTEPLETNEDEQPDLPEKQEGEEEVDKGEVEEQADAEAETVPLSGDPSLLAEFISEGVEHLENADAELLTLENDPHDRDAIAAVFRAFHTLKGLAGFLELGQIQDLAHEAETLLDKARNEELVLAGEYINVTFDSVDRMKQLVKNVKDALENGTELKQDNTVGALVKRLHALYSGEKPTTKIASGEQATPPEKIETISEEAFSFEEAESKDGGVSEETTDVDREQDEGAVAPSKSAESQVSVESTDKEADAQSAAEKSQSASSEETESAEPVQTNRDSGKNAAKADVVVANAKAGQKAQRVKETIKVDAERLDGLVDAIGELVISESMVRQSILKGAASTADDRENTAKNTLLQQLNQLDKITRELQEMGMSLRMVPLKPTFQRQARLVRDLSRKFNRPVKFAMEGEETELDKTVADKIADPLVHMVRNALDHGIESPEEREAAGKPPDGNVTLRAYQQGGSIYIELEDDGKGLDREKIREKAIERGIISAQTELTDREVFGLIFEPGFSTAQKLSDVSGRGVGMDVVKRNIESLRGQVDLESELGKGTKVIITLPLTLAIIDGMVIRVGSERYIIPTLSIVQSLRPGENELATVLKQGEMLALHGHQIPLFRVSKLFDIEDAEKDISKAIVTVVEDEGRKVGLLVDELLGQQQIVIKSMGAYLKNIPGVSGGAIMPDGTVGLILDVAGLVRIATRKGGDKRRVV